jgi:hypothetical protein
VRPPASSPCCVRHQPPPCAQEPPPDPCHAGAEPPPIPPHATTSLWLPSPTSPPPDPLLPDLGITRSASIEPIGARSHARVSLLRLRLRSHRPGEFDPAYVRSWDPQSRPEPWLRPSFSVHRTTQSASALPCSTRSGPAHQIGPAPPDVGLACLQPCSDPAAWPGFDSTAPTQPRSSPTASSWARSSPTAHSARISYSGPDLL